MTTLAAKKSETIKLLGDNSVRLSNCLSNPLRDGPLEKIWEGGGQNIKKIHTRENGMTKIHAQQVTHKKT